MIFRNSRILPGFYLSLSWTIIWLAVIVVLPLSALLIKTYSGGWDHFCSSILDSQVLAACKISFCLAFFAAIINGFIGTLVAWVIVRYRFFGRNFLNTTVDIPFALPTAVAGIALTTLYNPNEWLGQYLNIIGIHVVFTPLGMVLAMIFIGFPFVVRSVQPIIEWLPSDVEEAAACLGASRLQTIRYVILPSFLPSILTGMIMAYGRALGEYGSLIFISGNIPYKTEFAPLMIVSKIEQYDYTGATAIASVMLIASLLIVIIANFIQSWSHRI